MNNLYLGLEADCEVARWWDWSPSVIVWKLTGWRCVTRRAFVDMYLEACFARGDKGAYLVDDGFIEAWHAGRIRWPG